MARSWNHHIRDTITSWFTGREAGPNGKCRGRKCEAKAEVFLCCLYYTGRRMRVAERAVPMCRACAEKTLAKAQKTTQN